MTRNSQMQLRCVEERPRIIISIEDSLLCWVSPECRQSDCLGLKSFVFFVMGCIVRFVHVNDNVFQIIDIWLYHYYYCCCCCCYYYYCYYYNYYYWYTSTATVLGTLQ